MIFAHANAKDPVDAIYDLLIYELEIRAALEKWENHLTTLLSRSEDRTTATVPLGDGRDWPDHYRFLQGHGLLLAHPMAEQMGAVFLPVGGMRAGAAVTGSGHRTARAKD
ncbi:MAG: hypothetical protein AB7H90_04105 [Alphaproteobacteria bacterium]